MRAPADPDAVQPLSNAQRLVWTAQQLHPDAPIYNQAFAAVVDGRVDPARFGAALSRLVAEADVLRTTFTEVDGQAVQTVATELDHDVALLDLAGEPDPRAAFLAWSRARVREPLDLAARTFDVGLADLGAHGSGISLCQHHLVADASSIAILFRRLSELYVDPAAPGPLPSATAPAPAPVVGEHTGTGRRPALYGSPSRRDVGTAAARRRSDLDAATMASLDELVSSGPLRSITPDLGRFKAYLTALAAHLHRVSGESRLAIGIPLLNRPTPELRRTPGLFTEVFPLVLDVPEDATFRSLFDEVNRATQELFATSRPGTASADRNRHVNVTLNYLPMTFGPFAGMASDVEWIESGHMEPEHTLRLHVTDWNATGLHTLLLDANDEVLDHETQRRAVTHLRVLLDAMLADPDASIGAVALLGDHERQQVARLAVGPEPSPVDSVVAGLGTVLREHGADTAIIDGTRSWTFAELDTASRRVAAAVDAGDRVAVVIDRSAEAVITIAGVLRAGGTFVPVDPTWPGERIAHVVRDADVALVVTADDAGTLDDVDTTSAVPVRTFAELAATEPSDARLATPADDDLAYILYTSGSTGVPKGVEITHGAIAGYVAWARASYDRGDRLRFPLFTPLTFDLTLTSVLVPLTAGGTIEVHRRGEGSVDTAVREVMAAGTADIVKLTPSHLTLVQDMDLRGSRVRQLVLGGEDLTRTVAARVRQQLGDDLVIHNEYGPTEAAVGCVVEVHDPSSEAGGDSVPIGRPVHGMSAWVLDAGRNPVPFGVVGELWLGGRQVARGYVGRPDLTAERFHELPELGPGRFYRTGDLARMLGDGTLLYLGRSDDQVKIRGARVELGEVEAGLATHPALSTVVAVAHRRAQQSSSGPEQHCERCGFPSSHPDASFDDEGVCADCRAFEGYRDEAEVYFDTLDELRTILARARERSTSEYDCIALLSGGKDSSYALARLVDLGARPLAYTLDNGYIPDSAKENIRRVTEALGVDHVFGSTPAMNEIFVDSLQRHANVCNGCFKTIYTLSLAHAREHGIPLIVTGLSRGQFFETRLTAELFTAGPVTADEIDATVLEARRASHRVDDAPRRLLDTAMFDDDEIFQQVQFADFYRYTDVSLDDMLAYLDRRLPWVRPSDTGRSTNCTINDVGIFVHKRERGFHNYALPYAWDVRLGHKQRDAAMDELDDDIDPAYVQGVLDEIGYPTDVTAVSGGNRLVAYYVPRADVTPAELRAHAQQVLPAAMVPSQFVELDEVPLTSNGKVDRSALPDPGSARPELATAFLAPLTEAQRTIAGVWSDVIDVDRIGIRDDFFDLGGDSIMAIRIVARCSALGHPFELRELFEHPTVEQLAALHAGRAAAPPAGETPVPKHDERAPSTSDLERLAALLGQKGQGS